MPSGFLAFVLALIVAQTPSATLPEAVLYGRAAEVKTLLAAGADVNAPDDTGMTPLMVAAAQGDGAIARLLIAGGANVSAAAADGTTALMHAASANRGDLVRLLISSGADVNAKQAGGMAALMIAAVCETVFGTSETLASDIRAPHRTCGPPGS